MKYEGKSCSVELVQASVNGVTNTPIYTFILEYPRAIHAQLLTHRVFSKNSSSSRAVPIKKAIQQIKDNPAKPIWTSNQKGMQGPVIEDAPTLDILAKLWNGMFDTTVRFVELMANKPEDGGLNIHKQNAGRYLEPFQNIRVCLTSTEWENWDWLRVDVAAQPEIEELAKLIKQARDEAEPMILTHLEWHVPFVDRKRDSKGILRYYSGDQEINYKQALQISMSCAAQTSYRNLDDSLEKAEDMYEKLFAGQKVHASPSEHQAYPIVKEYLEKPESTDPDEVWQEGITHMDRHATLWSGNFKDWVQHRQLIPNHDPTKS